MTKTILILGASGLFGAQCSKTFNAAGWTVRHFDRKTENMTEAAKGADIILNGLNPPNYHNWAKIIPEITRDVIAAAKASGATVIIPGNVYPIGSTSGVWDENTPHNPSSRKGQIRKDMEAAYRKAALDGVQVINLRAGDVIDPDSDKTVLGLVVLKSLKQGKIALLGKPDVPHAWCYTPDFARAALGLAEMRDQLQMYEDVPMAGQTMSGDELRLILEQLTGQSIKLTAFPWWLMRVASPFWELARELLEMRYLWDTPHQLSGQKLQRLLPGFKLTSNKVAVANALSGDVYPDKPMMRSNVTV